MTNPNNRSESRNTIPQDDAVHQNQAPTTQPSGPLPEDPPGKIAARPQRETSHRQLSHHPSPGANRHPRRPHFSLAGSRAPPAHAPSFIDPSYYRLNPEYDQPADKPVWGLAKPLPRVVRGKHQGPQAQNGGDAQPRAQNGTQPAPQVAKIPSQQGDEERHDVITRQKLELSRLRNELARQKTCSEGRDTTSGVATNPGFGITQRGSQTSMERYGSPRQELNDPLAQYGATHSVSQMRHDFAHMQDPRSVGDGSLTPSRVLSDVPEVNEDRMPSSETVTESWDKDLEACKEQDEHDETYSEEAFEYGEEEGLHNWWAPIREKFKEPLAEGLATFVYALIALSTNLAVLTSQSKSGDFQSSNWASGLGIMIGIYIAGGISGGHLNPAISIILCVFRGFPPRKTAIYVFSQCFGAFIAAFIAFGIYKNAILELDGGTLNADPDYSGSAFLTGLQPWTSPAEGWANEFVATGILACAILALGDDMNAPPGAGMHAFVVGLVVTVLGMAFGYATGPCMNPARDLGPRLAALIVGYGGEIFKVDRAWWIWGGWGSTISGAFIGALLYDAFIFQGGESPVNYLGRRRPASARAPKSRKEWFGRWWREGSERSKSGHLS